MKTIYGRVASSGPHPRYGRFGVADGSAYGRGLSSQLQSKSFKAFDTTPGVNKYVPKTSTGFGVLAPKSTFEKRRMT